MNLLPAFGLMINIAQAFLPDWLWSTVLSSWFGYYNNLGKGLKNDSPHKLLNHIFVKPSIIIFQAKHTLIDFVWLRHLLK